MPETPVATVVIPTRDRVASLVRTVDALRRQDTSRPWELVVVDDGSSPRVSDSVLAGLPAGRLVRTPGAGPARARNAGIRAARGRYVLFTDDDTEPASAWIEAAIRHLEAHADHIGVEGRVTSPPFDPLHELSLVSERPGKYWTCNMAYRKDALERLGGFDEGFPYPHCEDLDLAFRALDGGRIGFSTEMAVLHHPRSMTFREQVRRARLTVSEMRLFERHRARYGRARRLPARLFPLVQATGFWRYMLGSAGRAPRRVAFAVALCAGYTLQVARSTLLAPRSIERGAP